MVGREPVSAFARRYGPWAIVAGASEGIGAAFARQLAARGLNLVVVARRAPPLVALADELESRHKVSVQPLALDLAEPESIAELLTVTSDREIGLLVWNAALSVMGPFLDQPVESHLLELEVNVRSPLVAVHELGGRMVARKKGGIILLSSLSGMQGTALVANYAATKAWNRVLAEGLWWELGKSGVDVLACVAGATDTPGYRTSAPRPGTDGNVPVQSPDAVAEEALAALGKRPSIVTGGKNRFAAALLSRLLPRKAAVKLMGRTMDRMYGE
jgi:short-subunit dehydrogenase